jgi:hypothetical protein
MTPGEYVFNFGGYCSVDVPMLTADDFSIDISPVFPRPTIDFSVDASNTLTIQYSSYLTDSTLISVYWNTKNATGGHAVLHHNYYDGIAQGDSTYMLTIENWDPGILTQSRIYVYAVIDDFVNAPVYSAIESTDYFENLENISGFVLNGTDSTVVVLRPADTTRSDVVALPTGMSSDGLTFSYYNIPPGDYALLCFSHDTAFTFLTSLQFDNLDGDYRLVYHSPEWVSVKFTAASWLNGIAQVTLKLQEQSVQLFGSVSDTAFAPINGVMLYLLDTLDELLQTVPLSESNYIITGLDTGQFVKMAVLLPSQNTYHWASVKQQEYLGNIEQSILQTTDHLKIGGTPKTAVFQAVPGSQGLVFLALAGDNSGPPLPGAVVGLRRQDGTGRSLHAVTNQYGLAFFQAEELSLNTWYIYDVSWPPGYEGPDDPANTHFWQGEIYPVRLFGMAE